MVSCSDCGLTFTLNPDYQAERYAAVYQGAQMDDESVYTSPLARLHLEVSSKLRLPPRLTTVEKFALRWLRKSAPVGAVILDIGCGSGRFLRACGRVGFEAVGVEISSDVVAALLGAGLQAILGMAPDFTWDGPDPFALTFFEVIEHLPDPRKEILELRRRFPRSVIIASVPSHFRRNPAATGRRGASDYPPNHFLRWTPKALELFFRKCGYGHVQVFLPPPDGSEFLPSLGYLLGKMGLLHSSSTRAQASRGLGSSACPTHWWPLIAFLTLFVHRLYQLMSDIVGWPKALHASRVGISSASMLVIASPGGAHGAFCSCLVHSTRSLTIPQAKAI